MKIKIGDKIYDANDVPIMIILSQADKDNIGNMLEDNFKYCSYPATGYSEDQIREFMKIDKVKVKDD